MILGYFLLRITGTAKPEESNSPCNIA